MPQGTATTGTESEGKAVTAIIRPVCRVHTFEFHMRNEFRDIRSISNVQIYYV